MTRARVLLVTAALGLTLGPAASPAVLPVGHVQNLGAFPFGLGPTPGRSNRIAIDPVAAVLEAPETTTTSTAAVAKPKQPVGDGKDEENKPDTRPKPKPAGLPLGSPFVGAYTGSEIEGYARYEGQSTCDPTPKSGTVALRDVLLARYANTSSLGISRACDVGGQSEHKEGRAFDWGANVANAAQVAAVNDFLSALFATDSAGHPHALARRMGVMYVIWNHQIWNAGHPGWEPYNGANPHTDHVHISLSWAGGRGQTSFWSGTVVPGLPDGLPRVRPPRTTTTRPTTTSTTRRPRYSTTTTTLVSPTSSTTSSSTSSTSTSSTTLAD